MANIILQQITTQELKQLIIEGVNESLEKHPIFDKIEKPEEEELLIQKDAAKFIKKSPLTLRKYTKEGIVPAYKYKNKRGILYKKSELLSACQQIKSKKHKM